MENNKSVEETAKEAMAKSSPQAQRKQLILWFGALLIGAVLGWMQIPALNGFFDFVLSQFTETVTIESASGTTFAAQKQESPDAKVSCPSGCCRIIKAYRYCQSSIILLSS